MNKDPKILIIIPAYNEEKNIGSVISDIKNNLPSADIAVINDGSTDNTSAIARIAGAIVIDLPTNLGIGGAMQTGYKFASENKYDIAIQVDADGQHAAAEIPKILNRLNQKDVEAVIGSRFVIENPKSFQSTFLRRMGITFFSKLISSILKQRITDATSGFRAVTKKVIEQFAIDYPEDYPEPEAIVLLHKLGFKIAEVPVTMSPRKASISSITRIQSIYYLVKVTLAILIDLLRKY